MAIYHLSAKPVQRSKGRSATASAAYRAAELIEDSRSGLIHDYTRKAGVMHKEIITPNGEAVERAVLWNLAEHAEKRKDGTPAREYEVALPDELTAAQRLELTREFAKYLAEEQGCAVDFAIHAPGKDGDQRNHHAHILCTTRRYESGQTLGTKCDIELSDRDRKKKGLPGRKIELEKAREKWAELNNQALEKAGHVARINHKSFLDRGIELIPTIHVGVSATSMERRGLETERGGHNRKVRSLNSELQNLIAEISAAEVAITAVETAPAAPLTLAQQMQSYLVELDGHSRTKQYQATQYYKDKQKAFEEAGQDHNDFYLAVRRDIASVITAERFEDYMTKEKAFADKRIKEHATELAELERHKPMSLLGLKKDTVRQWESACDYQRQEIRRFEQWKDPGQHQRRFLETKDHTNFHDIEAREAQYVAKLPSQDAKRYTDAKEINALLGEIQQKSTSIIMDINAQQRKQEQAQKKSLGRGR